MMDISVSGGAPGTDASASVRAGRGAGKGEAADQNGGFSDVLSKAGNADQDAVDTSDQHAADDSAEAAARNSRGRNPKPLIDLDDTSIKGQVDAQPETIANASKIPVKSEKDQGKTGIAFGLGKPGAKDQAAEIVAQAVGKPAKHTKTNELDGDTDVDAGADIEAGDGDVADVLGLLKKDPGDAAGVLQASAHQASAKIDDAGKKDAKTEGVHGAKADMHVSDALAAVAPHHDDARVPGTENAEGVEGKTFRISRADGRGQSMDIHIGTEEAGSEKSAKSGVENVSVLESRRYLGLVQNPNSATVTAALSGDSEWARAMQPSSALSNAAEWTSTGKVVNTLKIQMSPIDLGLVTATMRLSGDTLNVDLKVETGAAYRQLKEDHGKILEALRSQGYAVDNVTISMAPVERADAGNQANSQGQSSQQQSLAQQGQGQGGEARERQNQTAQQTNGGFNGAGGNGVENASTVDAGSRSSGSVYL
ncbi:MULTISPECIES: flagellar hook-length control protein FliK [unclassified Rhizobium]|uniref:flagellar hook-length control protein FliK n=1 Tax=unclassified Rhizobium TaxID=2613769 RepID=UPI00104D19E3|nr:MULTISPECIES: flagellar hook-length control protein FliK [unclassified Rhizobium]